MSSLAYRPQVNCFVCDIAENTTSLNCQSSILESLSKEVNDLEKNLDCLKSSLQKLFFSRSNTY